jgi:hypothetical protein
MVGYGSCLVVTRHKLLSVQQKDIESICSKIWIIPELPVEQSQLKELIGSYDTIVGTFSLSLQLQVLQNGKKLITFVMKSLGVADSKDEAYSKASQYPERAVVLAPSKEGEKYRVLTYQGLKEIKEIRVIDEWVIKYEN